MYIYFWMKFLTVFIHIYSLFIWVTEFKLKLIFSQHLNTSLCLPEAVQVQSYLLCHDLWFFFIWYSFVSPLWFIMFYRFWYDLTSIYFFAGSSIKLPGIPSYICFFGCLFSCNFGFFPRSISNDWYSGLIIIICFHLICFGSTSWEINYRSAYSHLKLKTCHT